MHSASETLFASSTVEVPNGEWWSVSFDGISICNTRPGFGVILRIRANQSIHTARDRLRDLFVLQTRDDAFHITLFQVRIDFDEEVYNPAALPNDLLISLKAHLGRVLGNTIKEAEEVICKSCVRVLDQWLLLGTMYPSHLAVQVDYGDVAGAVDELKARIHQAALEWMTQASYVLHRRGFKGDVIDGLTGTALCSDGWQLVVAYTGSKDYRAHITLGILTTGDRELDDLLVKAHSDVSRRVDPVFSTTNCTTTNDPSLIKRLRTHCAIKFRELKSHSTDDFPCLHFAVKHVDDHDTETNEVNPTVFREWGSFLLRDLQSHLKKAFTNKQCRFLKIHGIVGEVINTNRAPNYEVPPAARTASDF
ncbi:hypothetical protein HPB49_006501 [Dermacentor silvarum]|uniref:Uncharacterized protein n=1 Tax=Dermacentor silvarum TaxID=543639 RepID=A0ACB8CDT2_DERSI|nr:hypothetical protein HPB49_006501 [Dermacentor silvarum]